MAARAGIVAVAAARRLALSSPPELIRVGAGYSAKIVCSNVFIAGRDPDEVLEVDVQAPGHPLLEYMDVDVDREAKTVTAGLLGIFGKGTAVARDGFGCTRFRTASSMPCAGAGPGGRRRRLRTRCGRRATASSPRRTRHRRDPRRSGLTGPGMRAVVVVKNGRIVGERYGEGFSRRDAAARLVDDQVGDRGDHRHAGQGRQAAIDQKQLLEPWKADGRAAISVADLMAMSSGLEFNEDYGDVTDVTRMLSSEPDMAGFAAAKPLADRSARSSTIRAATTLILSRLWQDAAGAEALAWPKKALFDPIGMTSAVMETDARGTFVGSSYLYATARDWARFGQFLLQDGVWNGSEILPAGFVAWMREEAPASKGQYGKGQVWLYGPEGDTPAGARPGHRLRPARRHLLVRGP